MCFFVFALGTPRLKSKVQTPITGSLLYLFRQLEFFDFGLVCRMILQEASSLQNMHGFSHAAVISASLDEYLPHVTDYKSIILVMSLQR